jgi:hypothetical protein
MALLANRSLLRLVEFMSPNFNPRMPVKQPTFRERIRLLEAAMRLIRERSDDDLLLEAADDIAAEVARMQRAAARWEQKAPRANAKTGA